MLQLGDFWGNDGLAVGFFGVFFVVVFVVGFSVVEHLQRLHCGNDGFVPDFFFV